MKTLPVLIVIILLAACSYAGESVLVYENLKITAHYRSSTSQKDRNMHFLYGKVYIENTGLTTEQYGNKHLILVANGIPSRTYLDSLFSSTIDFSHVPIRSGEIKEIEVYWAFNNPLSVNLNRIKLQWHR